MKLKKIFCFLLQINIFSFSLFIYSYVDNLDTTFGSGKGYVSTPNAQGFQINRIRLQSDDKIVACGFTQDSNTKAIIARYNTDGTLDNTFGTNGIVTSSIGSNLSTTVLTDLAIQSDGKIVVVGYNFNGAGGSTLIVIARYTSTGVLDTTFNSTGVITVSLGNGSSANAVTIQNDGKIIVVGCAVTNDTARGFIIRYTSSGVLDNTFNSVGYVTPLLGIKTTFKAVVLDALGNIIVAGSYNQNGLSGDQFVIARYTTAGTLDTTFNNPNGYIVGSLGSNTLVNSITLDSSGNILIAGSFSNGTGNQFFIARYNSTGTIDTSFNNPNGYITNQVGKSSVANDIAVQSDGKIVVAGVVNYDNLQAVVARYNSNGTIDTTFETNGFLSLNLGIASVINGIAIQSTNSRVVAGGFVTDSTTNQPFGLLIRYNKNNSDFINITTITDNGTINTKTPTISGTSSIASATVQVLINNVLVATTTTNGSGNWNAGSTINFSTPLVLPAASNNIQVNLVVSGTTVVSHFTTFTVQDNLGQDSVLVYSTSTQTLSSSNSFTNITYTNLPLTSTWTNSGATTLICNVTGRYQITYNVSGNNNTILDNQTISIIVVKNGTEVAGSQSGVLLVPNDFKLISNSIILNVNAGDTIQCRFAGSSTNIRLIGNGSGTSLISAKLNIMRLS